MQLRVYAAIILFLGSYLPLSVILLVQDYRYDLWDSPLCRLPISSCTLPFRQPAISLSLVTICLACFVFTLVLLRTITPRRTIEATGVKHVPTDLMNYVLPYVVSFMGLDYGDIGKFIGFIVFLLWIFIITFKSERVIMNPILTVFGWKLYEMNYKSPGGKSVSTAMALSSVALSTGGTYRVHAVQDVMIIKYGGG